MAVLSAPTNTPTIDGAVIGCTTDDTSSTAYAMARTDRQWYSVANGDSQALVDADKATIIAQDITASELVWAGTDTDLATIQATVDGLDESDGPFYVGWVQEVETYDYFVRADGTAAGKASAVGPATDASACMSMATFNAETFAAGDTIGFSAQGGDFTDGLVFTGTGTIGAQLTLQGLGGDTPTIDVSAGSTACMYIGKETGEQPVMDYININNFQCVGSGNVGAVAVYSDFAGHDGDGYTIAINDVHVLNNFGNGTYSVNHDGFSLGYGSQVEFTDCTASRCRPNPQAAGSHQAFTAHDNSKMRLNNCSGTDSNSGYVGVANSEATINGGTWSNFYVSMMNANVGANLYINHAELIGDNIGFFPIAAAGATGELIMTGGSITATVGKQVITRGITHFAGVDMVFNSSLIRITVGSSPANELHISGCNITATDCSGYLFLEATGLVFLKNNTITGAMSDALVRHQSTGGQITGNLFHDMPNATISRIEAGYLAHVYNNTFYNVNKINLNYSTEDIKYKNNIYHTVTSFGSLSNVDATNNCYYNAPAWDANSSITSDPLFLVNGSDFNLQASSPAKDAGVDWWSPDPAPVDMNNATIVDCMGAYEL